MDRTEFTGGVDGQCNGRRPSYGAIAGLLLAAAVDAGCCGEAASGDRTHAWRTLLVWGAALIAGWLAFRRFGMSAEALVVAVYAWFFSRRGRIDLEHRRALNRMLLAALPLLPRRQPAPAQPAAAFSSRHGLGFGVFLLLALAFPAAWAWAM